MTEGRTQITQQSSMQAFLRPAPRPEWGRADVEWWWTLDDSMRLPVGDEIGHKCSVARCPNEAFLIRLQETYIWKTHTRYVRRSFRCREHVYTRVLVEEGKVYIAFPRFDMPVEEVVGLA